jgi:hybrid polyketide synthase/nonribosomal peptide synthetase ACE1
MRVPADSRVRHTTSVDLEVIQAAGEGLINALRGDSRLLETMRSGELLYKYFREALGMKPYLGEMGRVMRQLAHRFAHMNILEIGKSYRARS